MRNVATLKGRQVDPRALAEVEALLGDESRTRDQLVEHLHRLQDAFGHLSTPHLAALAHSMKLSMAEVWETATFYHRFDVTDDAPPALTIRVCESLSCVMAGADALSRALTIPGARVMRGPCMGACDVAPAVEIGRAQIGHATAEGVTVVALAGAPKPVIPAYVSLDDYLQEGGYALYRDALAGKRTADSLIAELEASRLRGLGGAGFPAGRKWKVVRAEPDPRYMALNADEGETGTF